MLRVVMNTRSIMKYSINLTRVFGVKYLSDLLHLSRKVGLPTNLILNNYRGNKNTAGGQAHLTEFLCSKILLIKTCNSTYIYFTTLKLNAIAGS